MTGQDLLGGLPDSVFAAVAVGDDAVPAGFLLGQAVSPSRPPRTGHRQAAARATAARTDRFGSVRYWPRSAVRSRECHGGAPTSRSPRLVCCVSGASCQSEG